MRIHVFAVGKPALAYVRDGVAEYVKRLQRYGGVRVQYVKKEAEAWQGIAGHFRVALDERGKNLSTQQWVEAWQAWELQPVKDLAFVIGPGDGHSGESRQKADAVWQLGAMTMNHELALLVLMEQIYRVQSLRSGHPYHREGSR